MVADEVGAGEHFVVFAAGFDGAGQVLVHHAQGRRVGIKGFAQLRGGLLQCFVRPVVADAVGEAVMAEDFLLCFVAVVVLLPVVRFVAHGS